MIGGLSIEYAQARLQARYGQRGHESLWTQLRGARTFGAALETLRGSPLREWVAAIVVDADADEVELRLRVGLRARVGEVAGWMPEAWQPAVRWVATLVDLPAVTQLAAGEAPPPWMKRDPVLRSYTEADAHARGAALRNGALGAVVRAIGARWAEERAKRATTEYDSAEYFRRSLEQSGALERAALFLNLASDSSTQRLLTPRFALTAAEYLAFEEGKHVLAILTDLTNYCEALREVAGAKGEVPGRKGYPGYMYSDLAALYERAGCLHGAKGTLTQFPILTMPADDIGHPIPDLSGYITEGQIVLSRELDRAGVYPPVNVLPSLSRLMKDGTGKGYTHADHPALSSQLYAAYARAIQARVLASVVGEDGVSETDRKYLAFGTRFEQELVSHPGPRTLEASMDTGWECLRGLPKTELARLSDAQIERHVEKRA